MVIHEGSPYFVRKHLSIECIIQWPSGGDLTVLKDDQKVPELQSESTISVHILCLNDGEKSHPYSIDFTSCITCLISRANFAIPRLLKWRPSFLKKVLLMDWNHWIQIFFPFGDTNIICCNYLTATAYILVSGMYNPSRQINTFDKQTRFFVVVSAIYWLHFICQFQS